ncbi:trimeric intracellular cation channel family protein [Salinisphaera sp. USBA-960]|uniref:trimeric intracellular cation channel family protein n=1 Tax=Salinisphaera orenii TaxID=856731 RepID=UPI000DBE9425|nr:trimeric intracellular cation channel family protein [Salifodinibacter halophilus]NNC26436.1 trimeric intracellular cation channel family protein [Salifodinibacter halophilus]
MEILLPLLNLSGTFVFAISGAMAGVNRQLDVFGVSVLAFVAGNVGGIGRDVLIGALPPAAIAHVHYSLISLTAALAVFFGHRLIDHIQSPILLFDAAGLALFAVAGSQKALEYGLPAPMAAVLGMITGIGGGMTRDVLVARVPAVLSGELYAVAALAGATLVVIGAQLAWPPVAITLVGAGVCFAIRLGALRRGWRLPVARHRK